MVPMNKPHSRSNMVELDCREALARAGSDLECLRNQRVLVTGGTGFFGTWLLESLVLANREQHLNCELWVLSRNPERFRATARHLFADPQLKLLAGDVRSFDFPKLEFNTIIHAAAEASAKLNSENPLQMIDTIVEGTRHTLDFALRCKAENFLFVSSGGIYGRQPLDVAQVGEDFLGGPDVTNPKNAYGEAKRLAELVAAIYAERNPLKLKIARCFAFVGPHLPIDAHFAIGNFIRDGLRGSPIVIQGDGTPLRSYQYAADLIVWLLAILNRGRPGTPYNVGSDQAISVAGLAQAVAEQFSPRPPVEIRGTPQPGTRPERYVPSVERATRELGVVNSVDLTTAIQKTIAWHQST